MLKVREWISTSPIHCQEKWQCYLLVGLVTQEWIFTGMSIYFIPLLLLLLFNKLFCSIELIKNQYNFSNYVTLANNLMPYDITPYLILDYSNRFYDNNTSPKDKIGFFFFSFYSLPFFLLLTCTIGYEAFSNFAGNSTTYFAGYGFIWELYNEPSILMLICCLFYLLGHGNLFLMGLIY